MDKKYRKLGILVLLIFLFWEKISLMLFGNEPENLGGFSDDSLNDDAGEDFVQPIDNQAIQEEEAEPEPEPEPVVKDSFTRATVEEPEPEPEPVKPIAIKEPEEAVAEVDEETYERQTDKTYEPLADSGGTIDYYIKPVDYTTLDMENNLMMRW